MPTGMPIILRTPQHFGDEPAQFRDAQHNPTDRDFVFDCPDIELRGAVLLLFKVRAVDEGRNAFWMNSGGQPVPNGIPKAGVNFAPQFVILPGSWMREAGTNCTSGLGPPMGP